MQRLQQFLGHAQWLCRPGFGHSPHLLGVWAHVLWGPPPLQFTHVKLLRSMCVVCVLALPGWSVVTLPGVVSRRPVFVYVDAALDGGVYRLGLFSHDLGSRSAVPPEELPNQQCAEARALLWGLKFILSVRLSADFLARQKMLGQTSPTNDTIHWRIAHVFVAMSSRPRTRAA